MSDPFQISKSLSPAGKKALMNVASRGGKGPASGNAQMYAASRLYAERSGRAAAKAGAGSQEAAELVGRGRGFGEAARQQRVIAVEAGTPGGRFHWAKKRINRKRTEELGNRLAAQKFRNEFLKPPGLP